MPYHIRPAQSTDSARLADLVREIGYFSWTQNQPPEATHQRVLKHLSLCLDDDSHSVYVACDDAEQAGSPAGLLGYVSIHWLPYLISKGPEGYISELFIRPAARGLGIGSALLDTAIAEGRWRGCDRMRLINIRHRESYLRGFYKKHGWEEREDAAIFQLAL